MHNAIKAKKNVQPKQREMNTPVSFKLAKLLTHTNFNQKSAETGYIIATGEESTDYFLDMINGKAIAAPTISEVVMWLYEKHGIWIIADPYIDFHCWTPRVFTRLNTNLGKYEGVLEFNSPTEAYEAAIEYTLKKLI